MIPSFPFGVGRSVSGGYLGQAGLLTQRAVDPEGLGSRT